MTAKVALIDGVEEPLPLTWMDRFENVPGGLVSVYTAVDDHQIVVGRTFMKAQRQWTPVFGRRVGLDEGIEELKEEIAERVREAAGPDPTPARVTEAEPKMEDPQPDEPNREKSEPEQESQRLKRETRPESECEPVEEASTETDANDAPEEEDETYLEDEWIAPRVDRSREHGPRVPPFSVVYDMATGPDSTLSKTARSVAIGIGRHLGSDTTPQGVQRCIAFLKHGTLAGELALHRVTVYRALAEIEAAQLFIIRKGGSAVHGKIRHCEYACWTYELP